MYLQLRWFSVLPLLVQLISLRLHVHLHIGGCDVILCMGQGGHCSLAGVEGYIVVGRAGGAGVVGAGVLLGQTTIWYIC